MKEESRTRFVPLILAACAAGGLFRLLSPPGEDRVAVEMIAQEIVRVRGGQSVVVLVEKKGSRRLAVPVSRAEGALIEEALQGARGLGAAAVDALGGRVLRASIDGALSLHDFRGHLSVGSGTREVRLDATAGEALSLALQAGATIVAERALLEEAGVSPDDLRGRRARDVRSEDAPAPVLGI